MEYPFKNLVFEGGGVKGIGYVGAMEVLTKKGILDKIERVGGTSAGAINALLLALNYSNEETKNILMELDFKKFLDDSWGVVRDTERLLTEFGWYKGDFFRNWIGKLIKKKTKNSNATFAELEGMGFKKIFFAGTNLSTRYSEIFSPEHTPRMCVADAVRISMSIPLFFAAKRSYRGDVYVDGGVLNNYPIKLFDRKKYVKTNFIERPYYKTHNARLKKANRDISPYVYNQETLGFRLDSAKEIAVFRDQAEPEHCKIDDFFSYAWGLINTIMEFQQNIHLHGDDWQRTIYIDTLGVNTTDFNLSEQMKLKLIDSGRKGAEKYFEWYDNPANKPFNRI